MKDRYLIDGHKLLWHPERVSAWAKGERIAPLHIELGITTGCNLACNYCYGVVMGQDTEEKRFDMPKEIIFRLFNDAKEIGVRSITLIGEGENTLNKHFYDALDYAKKINLDMALATNGIGLRKDKIKGMLEALTWMRFHISAATPQSYLTIHGRDGFKELLENIKSCVEMKKRYGLKTTIGMQMVLLVENAKDAIPLAKLGKKLGVDYLVIKPCSDTHDKRLKVPDKKYLEMRNLYREAENISDKNYSVIIKWKKLTNRGINDFKACRGTKFIISVNGKGNVAPCGHLFWYRKDEFNMGNVVRESLKDIVASDRYWQVQKKVETLNVNTECETNCLHYYINNFLQQLKSSPEHINFP